MIDKKIGEIALQAAEKAGEILLAHHGKTFKHHYKDGEPANTCTEIDLAANKCILNILTKEFPEHGILSEEAAELNPEAEYTWVVDPLDGTNNYLHGMDQFSVSIALYRGKEPIYGLVYQPVNNHCYWAAKGQGAFRGDRKLKVSNTDRLSEALVGVGFYYDRGELMKATLASIESFFGQEIHGIRRLGCASLDICFVAEARFDLFFEYTLSPWDFAAAALILTEAGGVISDFSNNNLELKTTSVLASNSVLHARAQELIV